MQKAKLETVNAATRYVVLSALTFLSALTIRDMVTSAWAMLEIKVRKSKTCDDDHKEKLASTMVSNLLFCIFVVGLMLFLAIFWRGTPGVFVLN